MICCLQILHQKNGTLLPKGKSYFACKASYCERFHNTSIGTSPIAVATKDTPEDYIYYNNITYSYHKMLLITCSYLAIRHKLSI